VVPDEVGAEKAVFQVRDEMRDGTVSPMLPEVEGGDGRPVWRVGGRVYLLKDIKRRPVIAPRRVFERGEIYNQQSREEEEEIKCYSWYMPFIHNLNGIKLAASPLILVLNHDHYLSIDAIA